MTGKQFYLIRCELDLTMQELAVKMGLHYDTIRKQEKRAVVRKVCELAILRLHDVYKKRAVSDDNKTNL